MELYYAWNSDYSPIQFVQTENNLPEAKKKEERRKKEKDINEAAKRRKQSFVRTVLRFLLSDILCSAFSSAFAIP